MYKKNYNLTFISKYNILPPKYRYTFMYMDAVINKTQTIFMTINKINYFVCKFRFNKTANLLDK